MKDIHLARYYFFLVLHRLYMLYARKEKNMVQPSDFQHDGFRLARVVTLNGCRCVFFWCVLFMCMHVCIFFSINLNMHRFHAYCLRFACSMKYCCGYKKIFHRRHCWVKILHSFLYCAVMFEWTAAYSPYTFVFGAAAVTKMKIMIAARLSLSVWFCCGCAAMETLNEQIARFNGTLALDSCDMEIKGRPANQHNCLNFLVNNDFKWLSD